MTRVPVVLILALLVRSVLAAENVNLLGNPGFEDAETPVWLANGRPKERIDPQIDEKVFRSGRSALRTGRNNFCQLVPVRQGRRYQVRGFLKCENMTGNGAHITVGAKDAAQKWVRGVWVLTESLRGTQGWQEFVSRPIVFPATTAYAWVACYGPQDAKDAKAGGAAWFDDLRFEDVTLAGLDKALKGRSLATLRKTRLDCFASPAMARLKAVAHKGFGELDPILKKPREEITGAEADRAQELVKQLDGLEYHAKIEKLLTTKP